MAQCGVGQVAANAGFGPPSISVAESSTAQVLEQVRRRQMAALSQPMPPPAAAAPPPEEEQAAAETEQAPEAEAAPPSGEAEKPAAAKKKPKKVAKAPAAEEYEPYEPKGFYEPVVREYAGNYNRRNAVWARGFVGWDRHSNLAPGQQENPTRNETQGGGMAGMDWTSHHSDHQTIQIGIFGGGSADHAGFSDTVFVLPATGDTYSRSDNKQNINGGFVGGYLTYRERNWLSDLALKTDIYDLSQKSTLAQLISGGPCGAAGAVGVQSGDSSLTSVTVAGNVTNRIRHGENNWIAPTAGFRYSSTFFGSNTSTTNFGATAAVPAPIPQLSTLGLQDGQALRLQGGVRFGGQWMGPHGETWETEVSALVYSDVWINGFTFLSTSGGVVTPVDEGKIRGLGQFVTKLNMGNGVSYLLQGEVYGGQDLIGVAGQAGMRVEW